MKYCILLTVSSIVTIEILCIPYNPDVSESICSHIDYRGKIDVHHNESWCADTHVCKMPFVISYIDVPPYTDYRDFFLRILHTCCGECVKISKVNRLANITEVTDSSLQDSHFIMPILGPATAVTLYGLYFIPVVSAPSAFYITPTPDALLIQLSVSCLELYPLFVICLLMAVISGFFVWIIETWYNEEFSRPFLIGWYEGSWWSFVSMTTVGYGDKITRTITGRIYSVFWICIGVTMVGILTALLTAEVMNASTHPEPHMSGANVGILKYREYEASFVAKSRGHIVENGNEAYDFDTDILLLMRKLRKREIHGVLLDRYTLYHIEHSLFNSKEVHPGARLEDIDFFINHTVRTEKRYGGEQLTYGILVKDKVVHKYFNDAIRDNRLPLETNVTLFLNKHIDFTPNLPSLFSASGPYFVHSLTVLLVIIGMISAFGILYELVRKKHCKACAKSTAHGNKINQADAIVRVTAQTKDE